jgi:signal transduction histidine kinase
LRRTKTLRLFRTTSGPPLGNVDRLRARVGSGLAECLAEGTSLENSRSAAPNRYAEMNERLSALNGIGAGAIVLLIALSLWGDWTALLVVALTQVPLIAFNVWVNLVYLPRRGRRAEVVRLFVNLAASVLVNRLAGWPMPAWLWLPYVALAFDHLDRAVAQRALFGFCAVQSAVALYDGVDWVYPLSATVFAIFASEISRLRHGVMRGMLRNSDEQRLALEQAHHSLNQAHEQLMTETRAREAAESELRQAHKLEAVGRLAAGVAHEINTPVQFVGDSLQFLAETSHEVFGVVEKLKSVESCVLEGRPALEAARAAHAAAEAADLAYAVENVPHALERMREGLARVGTIVRSMKEFAHPDRREMDAVDLNHGLETTLVIAKHEYKYVADLVTDFGELPPVVCHAGDVNQALLNVIVNAAHAIADVVGGSGRRGCITIRTRRDGDDVEVSVSDTGAGIPAEIRERVFEPFFTTKEVGRGSGQGLAIARAVIVKTHGGELTFDTEPGQGTTFRIRLPIEGAAARARRRPVAA